MEVIPVLVAYHSVDWVRVAVESYRQHFPEDRILVVDNNPRRTEPGWVPDCEKERAWLASHPGVLVIDNPVEAGDLPEGRQHGPAVDRAVDWCRTHGARVMVHLEPDCLITGRQWRDNLLTAIAGGAWMAGSHRQRHGPIHPTPTAWLVSEIRASFRIHVWKGPDEDHPRFKELVDLVRMQDDPTREVVWIRWMRCWDTGHKAWFEAALHDRTALVDTPGFKHYWHGSIDRRSERALIARHPELLPYLERGRARQKPRPVELCPYRDTVRDEARAEVGFCQLVQQLSGVTDPALCVVSRDACEACCASFSPSHLQVNPVVASLLYELSDRIVERGGAPGCSTSTAAAVRDKVEAELDLELP